MLTELKHNDARFLRFGRSFSRCEVPSNQSCVLSNEYYSGNETGDDVINDANDNITNSCRTYNASSGNWSSVTWYYLHMRGVINVSVVDLEFESESESDDIQSVYRNVSSNETMLDETVPSCANVSLRIQPFGTVPFQSKDDMLRRISNQENDVRFDTFRISGRVAPLFVYQTFNTRLL